jgi:3'(2'), 5'-bisphosphate nucleotidase
MLDRALVEGLSEAVTAASVAILAIARDAIDVRAKANATPVTAADERSQALLLAAVSRLMPGVDVVAEEMPDLPARPGDPFVLIDPLDGTK